MAVHQFADFELDEDSRQLRFRGREVTLQPRAFDLLAYLVNNRVRVVDKEELLDSLWPGVIVTDSSVQRAVSLARTALKSGGLDNAIRTYAGRGYRFVVEPAARGMSGTSCNERAADVEQARSLFDKGAWAEAAAGFEQADRDQALSAEDLENWGIALECAGATAAAVEPLARAAEAYSNASRCEDAARAVIFLARTYFETGEPAVARGCLRRAGTMLQNVPVCEQHGHLAWINSWLESHAGDLVATLEHAEQAIKIARQLGNVDLEAMGLLFRGIALQGIGNTREGLALQDEAGAMVLTGSVKPLLGGIVYCGLIAGCCNAGDWPRAGQWSDSFAQWCQRNGIRRFWGSCLLHRVEIFIARGELKKAEQELRDCDDTLALSGLGTIGDARRCLADVHLLRGELDLAETAYRSAYEHGTPPQPGYALLLYRRGEPEAAIRALRRSIEETDWSSGERKPLYLAFAAVIAGQSGNLEEAEASIEELDNQPALWAVGTTRGHVLRAKGELHMAWNEPGEAAALFRDALHIHHELDAPLEAAIARLRLAEALYGVADREGALLELDNAESTFKRCEATLYVDDCSALRSRIARTTTTG